MEFLNLYIVLLHVCYTLASTCESIAQRLNCTCDTERYPDGSGYTAKCLSGNVNLKYENSRHYFQVKCQNTVSIFDKKFSEFLAQDENIEEIKFEGCILPETAFPKPLYDLNIKKLVILCKGRSRPNTNWSAVMLQKLNYMEELLIQGCPTSQVPEDLLRYNPSLKKLYLEENEIQTLPEKLLYNVAQLKTFSLMNNEIKYIPDAFFKFSGQMENLNLKKNNLINVSLTGMKSLKSLDLSFNHFDNIPEDMFSDNSLMITLNLGWNKMVSVTTRPFKPLVNLKVMILSNNGPDISLPTRFLEGLVNLRNLSLSDCHMTMPPSDLLNWTRNLELLEFGNNRIKEFPTEFFQDLNKLEVLDLAFNDLKENISENTFRGLGNLHYLSVRKNNFSIFPDNLLKPLTKLTVLHLEQNFLEELEMSGQSIPFLKELYLTQNRISHWSKSGLPFGYRSGIETVDLSGNILTDLNVQMVAYNDLKLLDLSHNYFPIVNLPVTYSNNILIVKLSDCSIQTVNCWLNLQIRSLEGTCSLF